VEGLRVEVESKKRGGRREAPENVPKRMEARAARFFLLAHILNLQIGDLFLLNFVFECADAGFVVLREVV